MSIEELLQQARKLTPEEQLQLFASLLNTIREQYATKPNVRWGDVRGTAPYPLAGEDAQEWVSRTRQEGDDLRAQQLTYKT